MEKIINVLFSYEEELESISKRLEALGFFIIPWRSEDIREGHLFKGANLVFSSILKGPNLDNILKTCTSFAMVNSSKEIDEKVKEIVNSAPNCVGVLLLDYDEFLFSFSLKSIYDLSMVYLIEEKIDSAMDIASNELVKVKRLHERFVPMREGNYKGIAIMSKFAAGEASGGEFFDFFESDRSIVILMSSCNSYLLSSSILSQMENFRSEESFNIETVKNVIFSLMGELTLIQRTSKKNLNLDLCFLCIDRVSLEIQGYSFGEFELCSTGGRSLFHSNNFPCGFEFIEKAYFKGRLERGLNYYIMSPGVFKNDTSSLGKEYIVSLVRDNFEKNDVSSIINEIFYELKKNRKASFLDFDATVLSLEVKDNVIIQV